MGHSTECILNRSTLLPVCICGATRIAALEAQLVDREATIYEFHQRERREDGFPGECSCPACESYLAKHEEAQP